MVLKICACMPIFSWAWVVWRNLHQQTQLLQRAMTTCELFSQFDFDLISCVGCSTPPRVPSMAFFFLSLYPSFSFLLSISLPLSLQNGLGFPLFYCPLLVNDVLVLTLHRSWNHKHLNVVYIVTNLSSRTRQMVKKQVRESLMNSPI